MPKTKLPTPLELTQTLRDVSVTERGGFRTCHRRWHLEVIENLVPKAPQWALEFGTGMHSALEAYYYQHHMGPTRNATDPLVAAQNAFEEWHLDMDKRFQKELQGLYNEDVRTELRDMFDMGTSMLELYPKYESMTKVIWQDVLAVEGAGMDKFVNKRPKGYPSSADVIVHESGRCMVPIVNPFTKEPIEYEGGPVYLTARIDLLVERATPHKGLWIVDHKTSSGQPSDRGLDFDDQVTGYCYVVWRLTGKMPRGVIFNYLIKNAPKEPRWIQGNKNNGPHNDEGQALSTAKDQLTTPDQYRDALKSIGLYKRGKVTSDAHAECLNGLLAKGWDPFFRRFEPRRNLSEIQSFEHNLVFEYQDMVDAYENEDKRYPNLSTWWCPGCSVASICQAMNEGSDWEDVAQRSYMQGEDRKAL